MRVGSAGVEVAQRSHSAANAMRVPVSAWVELVCLLLIAFDGIPDAEQFTGIPAAAEIVIVRIEPSAGSQNTLTISLSPPFAYLAFLLRSPPAICSLDRSQHSEKPSPRALAQEANLGRSQRRIFMESYVRRLGVVGLVALAGLFPAGSAGAAAADEKHIEFDMVRSTAATNGNCLHDVTAHVRIESKGPVEHMDVHVSGLPPNTEFDFFVIQVPNAPFGMAWYQGDIETNHEGKGHQKFIGRFNIETFIVAQPPAGQPAPFVHNDAFPDAIANPATEPIHTFHLGLWFNSPTDAANAGCPPTITRFNGDHNAGIQVLSTQNFPNLEGPLKQLTP